MVRKGQIGFYRRLFIRGFPLTFYGRLLCILHYWLCLLLKLSYIVLPLGLRKKAYVTCDLTSADFCEALVYVYYANMYQHEAYKRSPRGLCVDAGAHIGFWSLREVSECGYILAFEPFRKSYWLLYNNLILNKLLYNRVRPVPLALGETVSRRCMEGTTLETMSISADQSTCSENSTVLVIPLDLYLDLMGIKEIRIIKIDVEGMELDVLKGLERRLRKRSIDVILAEIHNKLNLAHVYKRLAIYGYRLRVFKVSNGIYIMVASPWHYDSQYKVSAKSL